MSLVSHINDKKIIQRPYRYVFSLDTECYDNGNTFIWIVGYDDARDKSGFIRIKKFYDPKEVYEFLFEKDRINSVLTGSNLLFDLNTIPLIQDVIEQAGSLIFLRDKKEKAWGRKIKIIELQNFFHKSLKNLAEDFNISGHIDNHIIEHFYYLGKKEAHNIMIEACISHVKTGIRVFRAYEKLMLDTLNCKVDITPAKTAFGLYKRNYMPKDLSFQDNKHPDLDEMKKLTGKSYYGGRTENFVYGGFNNVSSLDINSSYPGQMVHENYPKFNQYDIISEISIEKFVIVLKEKEGSAYCNFYVPESNLIPMLPVIYDKKLCFPAGYLGGTWTFPEIRRAIKEGYNLLSVKNVVVFPRYEGNKMFGAFINICYALKLRPDTKIVGKLMMNSSYGKFGQKDPKESGWFPVGEDIEINSLNPEELIFFNDVLYEYVSDDEQTKNYKKQAFPIIAAYITAYGRLQLFDAMQGIGFENVFYCDTDSVHANDSAIKKAIENNLVAVHKSDLGKWSFDYQNARIEIRGLKYYRYHEIGKEWTYKIKGVGYRFKRQFWTDRAVLMTRFRKRATAIRTGSKVNQIYNILRRDRNPDPKRNFTGKKSVPFCLDETYLADLNLIEDIELT